MLGESQETLCSLIYIVNCLCLHFSVLQVHNQYGKEVLILYLMSTTCFKQDGTGTTKYCESYGMLQNTCLEHSMGKQVDSIMVGCEKGILKRLGD